MTRFGRLDRDRRASRRRCRRRSTRSPAPGGSHGLSTFPTKSSGSGEGVGMTSSSTPVVSICSESAPQPAQQQCREGDEEALARRMARIMTARSVRAASVGFREPHSSEGRRHRRRRPDRLQPPLPSRERVARGRPPDRAATARDRAGAQDARGRRHGARRLRVPAARQGRDRLGRREDVRRRQPRPARRRPAARPGHGARRPALRQRRDLHRPGQGPQRGRRGRRPHRRHRQPGQHQRADRPAERPGHPGRAVLRADPPRPQPGDLAARRQDRRPGHRRSRR